MPRSSSVLLSSLKLSTLIVCILILSALSFAAAPDRITGPFSAQQLVKLSVGVPLKAQPQYDKGPADPSLKLSYMTLLTVPSASQQKAISRLLAQQQDRRSPLYHKWLTPEQYADRFGLSPNDIKKLTDWLQSQGFSIVNVARGRNFIAFSGTAAQAESAFQTEIHNFDVAGEKHFSNITPPSIPAALSGIVSAVRGFNNFRPKSQAHRFEPDYTFLFQGQNIPFVAPGDVATIYDINALYSAGVDGTGETLAVIGQTGIFQADLTAFRTGFGLSGISCTTDASDIITACNTSNFRYVLVNGVPQNIYGDLSEADIDIEWSGAAARNAQVIFVTATDPNGAGVFDSLYYAIDNNVAPVLTLSYTTPCERAEIGFFGADEVELQKANSFGITFMNSSGDTGAAECDFGSNLATRGYAVAYPASSQYVTGVGGTMIPFSELNSTYWNTSNGGDGGSAKSYIPEQAWNDAQEFGVICTVANPCTLNGVTVTDWASAQNAIGIAADGGGVSNCVTVNSSGKCTSGFPRPTWQAGLNASAVNPGGIGEIQATTPTRYSPDVSLLGSANFPGYIVCTQGSCAGGISGMLNACFAGTGPCSIFGGTSVSSPVFAGIVTLLNQYLGSSGGLGNINPTLYSLAATPSNLAFHQVEVGNIGAFCSPGTPSNQPVALQCPSSGPNAGFLGFDASNFDPTTGYNLATGLGSVDATNLAIAWAASLLSATTTTVTSSQNPANFGVSVTFTATVTTTGSTPPTGTVTFNDGTTALGSGSLSTVGGFQVATFATSTLTAGTHSITAVYGGDSSNAGSTSAVLNQIIVAPTFAITTPTTPATALSGQSATSTFSVTPTSGTTTVPITFACNNLPDATVGCTFNPTQIAAGAAGGTAVPVTLTITTAGPNSGTVKPQQRRADHRSPWLPLTLPLAGIVMVGFAGRKMSKHSAIAGLCVSLALLGLLVACGGSNPPVAISVSPAGATVFASDTADGWPPQTATFTATVTHTSNTAVNWSVAPANGGSITSGGVYTAPTAAVGLPGSATITATSQADTTKTATATVTITPTTVPGSYQLTVTATEGPTSHTTPAFTLTVQ
jgi:subtilase family serine protease